MHPIRQLVSAVAFGVMSASALASTTVYTSSATFLSQVAPGFYTEQFTALAVVPPGSFSSNGFSYTITAPSGTYGDADFLSTNQIDEALTITFTGASVYAVGGNFFATDINPAFQSTSISLMLSDGTSVSFTPASFADSYRGFVSTVAITSLTIGRPGQSLYGSLDNLTVAAAVPEPASVVLATLGLVGVAAAARRRRQA